MIVDTTRRFHEISKRARPYPAYLLEPDDSALAVFAAGFLGHNDVVHFARAGLKCECVDTDKERLWEMSAIYPGGWVFHHEDAWEFAERAAEQERQWDVVSVDPFLGDAAERVWETLYLWLSLARRMLTVTVKADTITNVPFGCKASYFPRSDRAAWLVITRA